MFPGPELGVPLFLMVGHLVSALAFLSLQAVEAIGNGDDGQGRPEPSWVDPQTWLSFQGPSSGSGMGQGVLGQALRCGGFPHAPMLYEL